MERPDAAFADDRRARNPGSVATEKAIPDCARKASGNRTCPGASSGLRSEAAPHLLPPLHACFRRHVERGAHADVVKMLLEKPPCSALSGAAQQVEELVVRLQFA